jgi:hypothetical protein
MHLTLKGCVLQDKWITHLFLEKLLVNCKLLNFYETKFTLKGSRVQSFPPSPSGLWRGTQHCRLQEARFALRGYCREAGKLKGNSAI